MIISGLLVILIIYYTVLCECLSLKVSGIHLSNRTPLTPSLARLVSLSGGKSASVKRSYKKKISIHEIIDRIKSFLGKVFRYAREKGQSKISGNSVISKGKGKLKKTSTASNSNVRIMKEYQEFLANPPAYCKVSLGANVKEWIVTITGPEGTLYANETYRLQFKFPKDYPSKPPIVYFLKPVPRHVHVYSNGDICLNLLGRDWQPGMTAESIAVSILSMLSSAKEKKIPPGNAMHSENAPGQQQDQWMYHDDKC